LIAQFLKSGVLADGFLLPTDKGTPQGGVTRRCLLTSPSASSRNDMSGGHIIVERSKLAARAILRRRRGGHA
jgi:hypothetical protein